MIFTQWSEFIKEFKKLLKKYRSLEEDFNVFQDALEDDPIWEELPSEHIVAIAWLWEEVQGKFFKVRKFSCTSLRSNTDIRIIYRYNEDEKSIEFYEIKFIEIYHKNQKSNHDIERIKQYW